MPQKNLLVKKCKKMKPYSKNNLKLECFMK